MKHPCAPWPRYSRNNRFLMWRYSMQASGHGRNMSHVRWTSIVYCWAMPLLWYVAVRSTAYGKAFAHLCHHTGSNAWCQADMEDHYSRGHPDPAAHAASQSASACGAGSWRAGMVGNVVGVQATIETHDRCKHRYLTSTLWDAPLRKRAGTASYCT